MYIFNYLSLCQTIHLSNYLSIHLSRYMGKTWKDLRVGDIVHLSNNEMIPADILLLHSSDANGLCFIDTQVQYCRMYTVQSPKIIFILVHPKQLLIFHSLCLLCIFIGISSLLLFFITLSIVISLLNIMIAIGVSFSRS